ncbi:MAG: lipid II flippase MurJ, partial [Bacillota bacterium]
FIVWRDYLNRTFYAMQDTATPTWTGVAAVAVNVGLNLLLVRVMGLGGLALASSAEAFVGFALLLWRLRRRVGLLAGRRLALETGKVCLAAGLMGLAVAWGVGALPAGPGRRCSRGWRACSAAGAGGLRGGGREAHRADHLRRGGVRGAVPGAAGAAPRVFRAFGA